MRGISGRVEYKRASMVEREIEGEKKRDKKEGVRD